MKFTSIPEHIQRNIVQKLEIYEFAKFHGSSRESLKLSENVKTRITASMKVLSVQQSEGKVFLSFAKRKKMLGHCIRADRLQNSPFRIVSPDLTMNILEHPVSTNLTQQLSRLVLSSNISFRCLVLSSNFVFSLMREGANTNAIDCAEESFNELLEAAQVQELHSTMQIPPVYLKVPYMKKISLINVGCDLNDDDLLSLKMPHLSVYHTSTTNIGINQFLKQWLKNERQISDVTIGMKTNNMNTHKLNFDFIFNRITYSIVRSKNSSEVYRLYKDRENQLVVTAVDDRTINIKIT